MHLRGNFGLLQSSIINQRVVYTVHGIVLRMHQKRRRRLASDRNKWVQLKLVVSSPQAPRIKHYRKVRATAFFIGGVYGRIQTLLEMRAHRRRQVSARRKPEYSDLLRIDMPLRGIKAH